METVKNATPNWRSPYTDGITMTEEAQHLTKMHFIMCTTNPMVIQ